jgi:hypothetical protein
MVLYEGTRFLHGERSLRSKRHSRKDRSRSLNERIVGDGDTHPCSRRFVRRTAFDVRSGATGDPQFRVCTWAPVRRRRVNGDPASRPFRTYSRNGLVHSPRIAAPDGAKCQQLRRSSSGSSSSGWLGQTPARSSRPCTSSVFIPIPWHVVPLTCERGAYPLMHPVLALQDRLHEDCTKMAKIARAANLQSSPSSCNLRHFVQSSSAASMPCDHSLRPPQPTEPKEPTRPAFGEPIPNPNTRVKNDSRVWDGVSAPLWPPVQHVPISDPFLSASQQGLAAATGPGRSAQRAELDLDRGQRPSDSPRDRTGSALRFRVLPQNARY